MDYELYHDESKIKGYWHGMLLVPIPKKQVLVDLLKLARENADYPHPISLKDVRRFGKKFECADAWTTIGVSALMSRIRQNYPQYFYSGKRTNHHKEYSKFEDVVGAKIIIFRERDNLEKIAYVTDFGSKVEITFRIGLKGGLHSLGLDDEYIHIERMHFDGNEHYHRNLDRDRIVGRLRGLRDYCSISNRQDSIDDRSGKHSKIDCQNYDDCQLLQLTDLLVSSFRSILSSTVNAKHKMLVTPVRQIIQRYLQGFARMQNSRWRNSLWMSQCYLEKRNWKYEPIVMERENKEIQLAFPFFETTK